MARVLTTIGLVAVMIALVGAGWVAARGTAAPLAASGPMQTGTAFTYQGHLKDAGGVVTNTCDFQFGLFNAATGGTQMGSTVTASVVTVSNGLFTTQLDFGNGVFNGTTRYLDISVRCPAGSGAYSTLSPRQELTPTPYALALPGLYTQPNSTSTNVIGGLSSNSVSAGVAGATISGGGSTSTPNSVTDDFATVGGGNGNDSAGWAATVSGGEGNHASSTGAAVGGGVINTASGLAAAIGGGWDNTASDWYASVSGGFRNTASGFGATTGGGYNNLANASSTTVAGGSFGTASGELV